LFETAATEALTGAFVAIELSTTSVSFRARLAGVPHDLEDVVELLRAHGGRSTPARRTVIRAILSADGHHVTAPELLAEIRRTDPEFQESSTYRTLNRLVELGLLRQLHLGPGGAIYHLGTEPHHHLVCVHCGQVTHVPPAPFRSLRTRLERDHGFHIDADHSSSSGTCATCWSTRAQ
jgi:Fur family transcriptional regulator, ferric uptake regulator